jgi:hypothetical protein
MSTQNPCAVAHRFFDPNFNMHWTLQNVELALEIQGKVCSRCCEFKSIRDFYKQGNRHESLCKDCKRSSRAKQKNDTTIQESNSDSSAKSKVKDLKPILQNKLIPYERETMPTFDESIFNPDEATRALGLDDDDIECLVTYFRWQLEQREIRLRKEKEENT